MMSIWGMLTGGHGDLAWRSGFALSLLHRSNRVGIDHDIWSVVSGARIGRACDQAHLSSALMEDSDGVAAEETWQQ